MLVVSSVFFRRRFWFRRGKLRKRPFSVSTLYLFCALILSLQITTHAIIAYLQTFPQPSLENLPCFPFTGNDSPIYDRNVTMMQIRSS